VISEFGSFQLNLREGRRLQAIWKNSGGTGGGLNGYPQEGKALLSQPLTHSKSSKGASKQAAQALLSICHGTCCLFLLNLSILFLNR